MHEFAKRSCTGQQRDPSAFSRICYEISSNSSWNTFCVVILTAGHAIAVVGIIGWLDHVVGIGELVDGVCGFSSPEDVSA